MVDRLFVLPPYFFPFIFCLIVCLQRTLEWIFFIPTDSVEIKYAGTKRDGKLWRKLDLRFLAKVLFGSFQGINCLTPRHYAALHRIYESSKCFSLAIQEIKEKLITFFLNSFRRKIDQMNLTVKFVFGLQIK